MIEAYIKEIDKYDILTKEEERELMKKAKDGKEWARDKVINSNLRFVFQVAKSYQNQGLPLEDLIAEGNVGLMKAYERFDLDKNVKFISYAVWWIRQSILSALYNHSSSIRLPLNKLVNISKIAKIKAELEQELLREPTIYELEEAIEDEDLKNDVHHLHTIIRLDVPRTETGEADLHEVLEKKEVNLEKKLSNFRDEFLEVIKNFPDREQKIICMYYGIDYDRTYNLREIGAELDLTRERIRQIKEQTLEKIKKKPEGKKLGEFL